MKPYTKFVCRHTRRKIELLAFDAHQVVYRHIKGNLLMPLIVVNISDFLTKFDEVEQ